MNALLLITILVLVIGPAIVLVCRADRHESPVARTPFGFGPDADRIHDELVVLRLYHRDCA